MVVQGEPVHERGPGLAAARDLEGDERARALRQVALGPLVPRAGLQAGVDHVLDVVAALQPARHRGRVGHLPLHAQGQGLQAEVHQERVERGDGRAVVAQQLHARLEDEGQVGAERRAHPEVPRVDEAVVGLVRLVEAGVPLGVLRVVERAGVDDHARDGRGVPAEVLRGGVGDDVGAVLDRPQQVRGGQRVVHDQRHAGLVGGVGDGAHVQDVPARVAEGLAEERLGVRPDGGAPGLEVVRVGHERRLDADLGEGVLEQVLRAAVEAGRGDHVVAGAGEVEDRERGRRLTGGQQQRAHTALERGDLLLHRALRRVADAGVERVEVLEREPVRGHLGGREVVRGGLEDRQGGRTEGVLADGDARVDLRGGEAPGVGGRGGLVGHGGHS